MPTGGEGTAEKEAVRHFTRWLDRLTPCAFAPDYAKPEKTPDGIDSPAKMHFVVAPANFSAEHVGRAEKLFDFAGQTGRFAGILWPHVRTPVELLEAILIWFRSDRWECHRVQWGEKYVRSEDLLLGMTWRTATGEPTSVMGFAPHGSMPVARRAPYAAAVFWPGKRCNRFAAPEDVIGFIDAAHAFDDDEPGYVAARSRSWNSTNKMMRYAPDDQRLFRSVAFCLPSTEVAPYLDRLERR